MLGDERENIAAGKQLAILAIHPDAHITSLGVAGIFVKEILLGRDWGYHFEDDSFSR